MKQILNFSEASNLAVHALAYMAGAQSGQPMSAARIARDLSISESHLSKVLQRLARVDFIGSVRGANGGFFLSRDADEITLLEIVEAVDGPIRGGGCMMGEPVCAAGHCNLQSLSASIADQVSNALGNISLSEILITPKRESA